MKFRLATLLLLGAVSAALAQDMGSGLNNPTTSSGSSAPCTAFGTTTGTCAQGGVITAGGPTGSATVAPIITYNGAGQLTAVSSATITPAIGSVTGLGTGVATALGNAPNATGGPVTATGACQAWTPTDQSGASLSFTSVSAQFCQYGNLVFAYGTLTYPSTSDTNQATISLPVAVPNQSYAAVFGSIAGYSANEFIKAVKGTSTAQLLGAALAGQTNTNLSTKTIIFMIIYPAS